MSDWHVVSMVSEPPQLVLAFTAHWLERGAGEVHLFLDGPDADLRDRLAQVPGCRVTLMDRSYWGGARPGRQVDRQLAMLQRAYDTARVPWLLHVDADEALHPEVDLNEVLRGVPSRVRKVRLGVAERVHLGAIDPGDIFAGVFRRPTPPELAEQVAAIDGPMARFLDQGMTGYPSHKSLVRTGKGYRVGIHGAKAAGKGIFLPGTLLHFDGMTAANWTQKRLRVIAQQLRCHSHGTRPRQAQFRHLLRRGPDAGLYSDLKVLSAERAAALDALGLLLHVRHDPRPACATHLPGPPPDLSAAAFDALRLNIPERRDPRSLWLRARRRLEVMRDPD